METVPKPIGLSDPPPPASRAPRWVMLKRRYDDDVDDDDADSSVADANTTAASCTSSGQRFTVSFAIAPPPATTRFYCNWLGAAAGAAAGDANNHFSVHEVFPRVRAHDKSMDLSIIAAHDDSVLIKMRVPEVPGGVRHTLTASFDYFLYETGGAAAAPRPPTLTLLPGCYDSTEFFERESDDDRDRPHSLDVANTAVLRRDGGELLVAHLQVLYGDGEPPDDTAEPYDTAELCVLRPGREWELKQLRIEHHDGGVLPAEWPHMDAAVAVGGRFMCCVDYVTGLFVCDVADTSSELRLRYVPLPVPMPQQYKVCADRPYMAYCRNLAADGQDAVRFVSVGPRCCCGGAGKTECERSRFAFNVTTWNLTLKMEEPMKWVKDVVLDCDELWQLPNYGSLPRVPLQYPIVSSDNPDIVCFTLRERNYIEKGDYTEWMLQVDTRRKELLSVIRGDTDLYMDDRVPANLRWQ